jgi:hypothetical protein
MQQNQQYDQATSILYCVLYTTFSISINQLAVAITDDVIPCGTVFSNRVAAYRVYCVSLLTLQYYVLHAMLVHKLYAVLTHKLHR